MANRPKLEHLAYMLAVYSNKTIPQTYIMEMSNYELLLALMNKVNELIERNQTFTDVINEIIALINEFDDTVKEEVERVLNEMYDSGEFDDIIESIITPALVSKVLIDKTGSLDLSHMGFVTHIAHNYQDDSTTSYNEQLYSYAQGNNVFEIDGVKYWCVCAVRQNTTQNDQKDDGMTLYVYQFNDNGNMVYLTHRHYNAIGHANGCCYYNGYIYITPNSYATGNNAGLTSDIHRISFDGESLGLIQETKTIPLGYSGGWVDFPAVYNNELYVVDKFMNVLKYDWDSNTFTIEYETINGDLGYSGEGMSIDDNFIYFGNSANLRIKRYNKNLGKVDWVYQIPTVSNNRMYKTGEIEGFTIYNGILYVLGAYNLGANILINDYNIWHFYRQNLKTNDISPTNSFGGWSSGLTGEGVTFYVAGDLPSDTDNPINPSGLYINSLEHPNQSFPSVQHALDYIEGNEWIKKANISVYQARNLSQIIVKTEKSITITGTKYMNDFSTYTGTTITGYVKPRVGHIYLYKCNNVQIDNLGISNMLPNALYDGTINNNINVSISDFLNNCIRIDDCANVCLNDIYFPTGLDSNKKYVIYALNVSRSNVQLRIDMNLYFDTDKTGAKGTPFYAWTTYRNSVISDPQSPIMYCNAFNSTINTHEAIRYMNDSSGNYQNLYIDNDVIRVRNNNFVY